VHYREKGKSFFALSKLYAKTHARVDDSISFAPLDATELNEEDDSQVSVDDAAAATLNSLLMDIDTEGLGDRYGTDANAKSPNGNHVPKARFGRRRTHNEQLVVACCGVIIARGTMYGAEALSGVRVSMSWIKKVAI